MVVRGRGHLRVGYGAHLFAFPVWDVADAGGDDGICPYTRTFLNVDLYRLRTKLIMKTKLSSNIN